MIDAELLEILACPEDKSPLHLAEEVEIEALNTGIREGTVLNRGGEVVTEEIHGGLIRQDGRYLYPIREEIPIMLIEESIPLGEG